MSTDDTARGDQPDTHTTDADTNANDVTPTPAARGLLDALFRTDHTRYKLHCRTKGCYASPIAFVTLPAGRPRPYCGQCAGTLLMSRTTAAREYPVTECRRGGDATLTKCAESQSGVRYELSTDDDNAEAWVSATNTYDDDTGAGSRSVVDLGEVC